MIVLFTDFGLHGPYLGQVRAVLQQYAPQVPVIDLFADAPMYDPKASAYLLASYIQGFPPEAVFLAVVDPGVGTTERLPIIVKADDYWFVGPDNGLFNVIAADAHTLQAWHVTWKPAQLSASFHGRDLFAPLAAKLALGVRPSDDYLQPAELEAWHEPLKQVIYVDHFGNLITGIRASLVSHDGSLMIGDVTVPRGHTFGDVPPGSPLCYENSNGLLEVAVNQGHAASYFAAAVGTPVALSPACE